MVRASWALLAALVLGLLAPVYHAADKEPAKPATDPKATAEKAPAGKWKVNVALEGAPTTLWLAQFSQKDNTWTGEILASSDSLRGDDASAAKISGIRVKDGLLTYSIKMPQVRLEMEVRLGDDNNKLLGTAMINGRLTPVQMERTMLASLDSFEVNKEIVATRTDGMEVVPAAINLVGKAGFMKAKPEEVRSWTDKALKSAEPYGPRWQRQVLLRLVELLNDQDGMAQVALPYARRAERLMTPKDRLPVQQKTLELLAAALDRAGKGAEAKEVQTRLGKLDLSVRTEPYAGRTSKSNRVVLVELFTGAECPPCVAADLAFDALEKTFKPTEVVLLQYHEHIPGPDPLANATTAERMKYYQEAFGRAVGGTPSMIFNGEPTAGGGGPKSAAQDKYDQYCEVIKPLLEKDSRAQIKLTATHKDDKIDIKAEVSDLKDTGESVRLRFVLVEEKVDYTGGNRLPAHHCVVRAMPGGAKGFALKDKTAKQNVTVNLADLKKELTKYLDDFCKEQSVELKERPMEFKNLRVVALVQDDNTREVLQAVEVKLEAAK